MTTSPPKLRWQVADLDGLPDNGSRYEIIAGDLQVTRAPRIDHQDIAGAIYAELRAWSKRSGLGRAVFGPGVIFSETDAVIPDVVWLSHEQFQKIVDETGHLQGAPELVVEVLSPSEQDKKRDRITKLKLYSMEGVVEYWILDPEHPALEVYRREEGVLTKVLTLYADDAITSPLLPEFRAQVREFLA